ncbi:MAG: hypothetical protein P1P86_00580 [Bacteroidales bacterium]|nr:hypothetical protein [Bacteroidales bacterium]
MMLKRALYLAIFLFVSLSVEAQINVYMGGNLQRNFSRIRGDEATREPGFGGGVNFVYWEYEYWFLKAGIDYNRRNSSALDYPDDYGITPVGPDDKIQITFTEQTLGIPLVLYFRPLESNGNTLLLTGSMNTMMVVGLKENSEEYGETTLKGDGIKNRIKSSLGIGIGYQRQLDKQMFLNLVPSYNIDLRGDRSFNSISITLELIFGVY